MAFNETDQQLMDECIKDEIDLNKIKALIADGADINAFDEEYEQALFDEILDYYIFEGRKRRLNLYNLYKITEVFMENNLILNQKPEDSDYFLPKGFRFLPPEKASVDAFRLMLEKGEASFKNLESIVADATLDLHLGVFYFFEQTRNYSEEDSIKYYLELIYWALACCIKNYPEKCEKELLQFNWFNREDNTMMFVCENSSTSVFIEDKKTHKRAEIDGWTSGDL